MKIENHTKTTAVVHTLTITLTEDEVYAFGTVLDYAGAAIPASSTASDIPIRATLRELADVFENI